MEIKLERIKHNKRLSEETECFSADLFLNGQARGTVMNRGTGGQHEYSDNEAMKELYRHAATLPKRFVDFEGGEFSFTPDGDTLINEVLMQWVDLQMLKSWCRRAIVLKMPGGKWGEYRQVRERYTVEKAEELKKMFPGVVIMNEELEKKGFVLG